MTLMLDDAMPPTQVAVRMFSASPKMSLPGLQLEAPVETGSTPTVHDIRENSEWRFEVAFGSKVEVKVGGNSIGIIQNTGADSCGFANLASFWHCRAIWDRTRSKANLHFQWNQSSNIHLAGMSS